MYNEMFEHAKCLVAEFKFTGGYGITSHGFDVLPGQLTEGQQFRLEGGEWTIEYVDGTRFIIRSLSTFQQCKELMPGLYSRAFDAEVVPGLDKWAVSLFDMDCVDMNRAGIKAKWSCVDCGDRIILADGGIVAGYIYKHNAKPEVWSSLVTYLCEGRGLLSTMILRLRPDDIAAEAQDVKKNYTYILDGGVVRLVNGSKIVGAIYQDKLGPAIWAAMKHYLVEM